LNFQKDDLKKALREEWERISPEWTKKLVESIPDRLKEVTVNRGFPTQDWKNLEAREISFIYN